MFVALYECIFVCMYEYVGYHSVGTLCGHLRLPSRILADQLVAHIGDIPLGSAGQGGVCGCGMYVFIYLCMYYHNRFILVIIDDSVTHL